MFSRRVNFKPIFRPVGGGVLRPVPGGGGGGSSSSWPESVGFVIWGSGPCFVVHVEPWSPMARQISAGDQIVGVDDIPPNEVVRMDAAALKAEVVRRRSHGRMTTRGLDAPSLKVVARTKEIQILSSERYKYGFTVRGSLPVQVSSFC